MKWPCVSIPSLYGFDLASWQIGPPQPPLMPPPQHVLLTPVGKCPTAAPPPSMMSGKLQPAVQADDAGSEIAAVASAIDPVVAAVMAQSAVPMGARK